MRIMINPSHGINGLFAGDDTTAVIFLASKTLLDNLLAFLLKEVK